MLSAALFPKRQAASVSTSTRCPPSRTGAVGLSGLLEKDVNQEVALKLGEICRANSMDVFQLRVATLVS